MVPALRRSVNHARWQAISHVSGGGKEFPGGGGTACGASVEWTNDPDGSVPGRRQKDPGHDEGPRYAALAYAPRTVIPLSEY
ncbi:hypothetical protein GCM10010448_29060 [Streptomyces glomeratus]|uniref:Uncharacterized protein n=1 Tax=Streptomyces glomeratus TaxID=284452 RepID=A0ABP6LKT7_9ACTN